MGMWNITKVISVKLPSEILKKYADDLTEESDGKLTARCDIKIVDTNYIHTYLFVNKMRLIETHECIDTYPMSLYLNTYNGLVSIKHNIKTPEELEKEMENLISSEKVSNILRHLLRVYEIENKKK